MQKNRFGKKKLTFSLSQNFFKKRLVKTQNQNKSIHEYNKILLNEKRILYKRKKFFLSKSTKLNDRYWKLLIKNPI